MIETWNGPAPLAKGPGPKKIAATAREQVPSADHCNAGDDHSTPATPADLSRHLRDEGIRRSDDSTDSWTRSCWRVGIDYWASTGLPFGSDEVREMGVPEPRSPGSIGAMFAAAYKAGVIRPHGFVQSRRASRHASWQRQWIGGTAA